mmetsp:Transcript_6095/g.15058  ORF Transcript_6095/g.15058 Transcript_6095/m.15058 type:complete len:113 (+) Transcript_6095:45-383(+)
MATSPSMKLIASSLGRRLARTRLVQPTRGGGGGPVASSKTPTEPLAEGDELTWDDGTAYPEPCLDDFSLLGKNQAAGMLLMGLGGFAALGFALQARDKASMKPYVQRKVMED